VKNELLKICSGTPGLSGATTPETPAVEMAEAATSLLGERTPQSMLVMSGGEGYIDFRVGKSPSAPLLYNKCLLLDTNHIIKRLVSKISYLPASQKFCTFHFGLKLLILWFFVSM
jgi:hypothetical protein